MSRSLLSKVSCPWHSLFSACTHKMGTGCHVLFFFVSLLLKFTKTMVIFWQLSQVQCKYQPGTNPIFQCLTLAITFTLVIFSNHTKLEKSVQISPSFLCYSNLDLKVTRMWTDGKWIHFHLQWKCTGHVAGKRSLFNVINGHYYTMARLWTFACDRERGDFIP